MADGGSKACMLAPWSGSKACVDIPGADVQALIGPWNCKSNLRLLDYFSADFSAVDSEQSLCGD